VKIRKNFVANSSSSSFTIYTKDEKDIEEWKIGSKYFIDHISSDDDLIRINTVGDCFDYIKEKCIVGKISDKVEYSKERGLVFTINPNPNTVSRYMAKMLQFTSKRDHWDVSRKMLQSLKEKGDLHYEQYIMEVLKGSGWFSNDSRDSWNEVFEGFKKRVDEGYSIYIVVLNHSGGGPRSDLEDTMAKMDSKEFIAFLRKNGVECDEIEKEYM